MILLDTHIVYWIVHRGQRMKAFRWLERYQPWTVSPVSLLEMQVLFESGRIPYITHFASVLAEDPRFDLGDLQLTELIEHATPLTWTRDPFDRLLCAHSLAHRLPFCTADGTIREHHKLLPRELK